MSTEPARESLAEEVARLREALRESERRSRLLLDTIPGLVAMLTPTGEVDAVNHELVEYCGQPLEAMKQWGTNGTVHSADLPDIVPVFSQAIASGKPYDFEARIRRFDGVYRWCQVRGLPLCDASGYVSRWYVLLTDIDDRKRAEHGVRASERNLKLIIDTIPALAWSARPDGSADFFNQHYLDYVGLSSEQASGWGWTAAVYPDDLQGLAATWHRALTSEAPREAEARLRRHDGAYRWFLFRANPLRDERGTIVKWYGVNTDIEDRKRADDAVSTSERRFRLLVETIPALVWCGTAEGELDYLNQRAVEYLGHTAQELTGGRWMDLVHPDHRDAVVQRWLQSATTGSSYEDVYRIRRADGEYRWIQSVGEPFYDTAGRIVRWYGLVIDIENQKQVEDELRRSEAFLVEGQHLARIGNFSWRVGTGDITWSEQIYRMFGFEPGTRVVLETLGSRVHPEDVPMLHDMVEKARRGVSDFEYEHRLLMPDQSIKFLHLIAHRTLDEQGRLEYIGAVQDVTQRRLSEQALSEARAELAHVTRVMSLGTLTASIAHELNQPLSGIITNAGTCLRMLDADPPNLEGARETARRTIRDSNRASAVIERLRGLFSKREFTPESMDLNEATREVIALSLGELQRSQVVLQSELADDLPTITGDRVQLQQVVLNLLRNASDAMVNVDDRPRQLLIRTEREDGERVRLSVRDTGVGVDAKDLQKLFDAFFTTKVGGMGIGLSVSRSIVERHHGRLWAEPNDGPGATFSFSIPRGAENVAVEPRKNPQ
jgi:PAS domain S-box-containing protein